MPMYTFGIICFFVYTLMKVILSHKSYPNFHECCSDLYLRYSIFCIHTYLHMYTCAILLLAFCTYLLYVILLSLLSILARFLVFHGQCDLRLCVFVSLRKLE